jgi:hypothetical protein
MVGRWRAAAGAHTAGGEEEEQEKRHRRGSRPGLAPQPLFISPAQRRLDFCCLGEPARLAGESAAAKSPLAIQQPNFRSICSEEQVLRWLD